MPTDTETLNAMQHARGAGSVGSGDHAVINNFLKPIPGAFSGLSMGGKGMADIITGGIANVKPGAALTPTPGAALKTDILGRGGSEGPGH